MPLNPKEAPETLLNQYCQQKRINPKIELMQKNALSWSCSIEVKGVPRVETIAGTKADAKRMALNAVVGKLRSSGLLMTLKQQGGQSGPSWAIKAEAEPAAKKFKTEQSWTSKKKAVPQATGQIRKMTDLVSAGRAEQALEIAQKQMPNPGCVSSKSFGDMISWMAVRNNETAFLTILQHCQSAALVDFPDEACAAYFSRFARWASREFLGQGTSSLELIGRTPMNVLERNGHCVPQLMVGEAKKNELRLDGQLPQQHGFQRGDCLFVTFPPDKDVDPAPDSKTTFEAELAGFVTPIPPQQGMNVKLWGLTNDMNPSDFEGKYCRVDRAANRVTFSRQVEALKSLCGPKEKRGWLRQTLLAGDEPGGAGIEAFLCGQEPPAQGLPSNSSLLQAVNPSQHNALKAGMSRHLTLIQGPPGSGKTSTALLLIRFLVQAGRGPVLATAESNIAVDNLLRGCGKAGLRVVRVGRAEASHQDLEQYSLMEQGKAKSGKPFSDIKVEREIVKQAEVVCCTCSGAALPVLQNTTFSSVLVDEAAQATELAVLVPLLHLTPDGCAVLVGDHKQLPATVGNIESDVEGFGTSLFERLAAHGVDPLLLDVQYRMHPAIAEFPSRQYYKGRLRSGTVGHARRAPRGVGWPISEVPVLFLPVEGTESNDGNSYLNGAEAESVITILHGLLDGFDVKPEDIGVITPYAAQARLLRRQLGCPPPGRREPGRAKPTGTAAVEVSSVDGYQGREKDVIIVSTVRANAMGKVGFVGDPRRMNVTLTRAKRGLIVIGNFETLAADADGWRPWLAWAQQRGVFVGCEPTAPEEAEFTWTLDELEAQDLLSVHFAS